MRGEEEHSNAILLVNFILILLLPYEGKINETLNFENTSNLKEEFLYDSFNKQI